MRKRHVEGHVEEPQPHRDPREAGQETPEEIGGTRGKTHADIIRETTRREPPRREPTRAPREERS